jgi:demethylmenaquinone methyltransferase/2-methoxy-6-polyprenyl-1,4-benzoquinol methylase
MDNLENMNNLNNIQPIYSSRAQTRAYYNKISKFYDILANHSEAPVRRIGLDKLSARPGEKILEIGYGTGHCLVDLAKAVCSSGIVYGIDLSNEMMNRALRVLGNEGLISRVDLSCGDALNSPYDAGMMDAVFMSFTLELFDIDEIPMLLQECQRVLRIGGRMVIVGMSKAGRASLTVKAFEWIHSHYPDFVDCRPIYIEEAMEASGFKIVEAVRRRRWIPVEIVLGMKE